MNSSPYRHPRFIFRLAIILLVLVGAASLYTMWNLLGDARMRLQSVDAINSQQDNFSFSRDEVIARTAQMVIGLLAFISLASIVLVAISRQLVFRYMAERDRAMAKLQEENEHLEQTVRQRTADLSSLADWLSAQALEREKTLQNVRESEERFRRLVDLNPDAIWLNCDGRIVFANLAAARLAGVEQPTDLLNKPVLELIHPDDHHLVRSRMQTLLETAGTVPVIEERIIRPDGSIRHVEVAATYTAENGRPAFLALLHDITEKKRVAAADAARARDINARLQGVREAERSRIAREVHDELGQALTGLKLELAWLKSRLQKPTSEWKGPPLVEKLDGMVGSVDEIIRSVRRIAADLRPGVLDELGLTAALEWLGQDFQARSGIGCVVVAEEVHVNRPLATAFFRVCQEALTNVLRHAGASQVSVSLHTNLGELCLEIHDDGRGITAEELRGQRSLGLVGMRERATLIGGNLSIAPDRHKGTMIRMSAPVQTEEANDDSGSRY